MHLKSILHSKNEPIKALDVARVGDAPEPGESRLEKQWSDERVSPNLGHVSREESFAL